MRKRVLDTLDIIIGMVLLQQCLAKLPADELNVYDGLRDDIVKANTDNERQKILTAILEFFIATTRQVGGFYF